MKTILRFVVFLLLIAHAGLAAESPRLIPFQGRLTDQQGVAYSNGQFTVLFQLYDGPVGGTPLWSERHEKVGVMNGMVNVFLGSISSLASVSFSETRHLGITIDADNNPNTPDPEMVPRQMIIPAFWAKNSDKLAGQDWAPIFGANSPLGPIPATKIQPKGITAAQIAQGAIGNAEIGDQAISDRHVGILSHLTTSDGLGTNALNIDENSRVFIRNSLRFRNYDDMAIYLFSSDVNYGMGIQPSTTYFRTGVQFSWFRNGVHRGVQANDPGPGGESLMLLNADGNLTVRGVFVNNSDRNVKQNFRDVDPRAFLAKLDAIQIQTWTYTNDSRGTRHIGPIAQDFHAAFGVGADDKHIATVDEGGVALVAIQGLHQMMKEKDVEIASLKKAMEEMQKTVKLLLRESKRDKD